MRRPRRLVPSASASRIRAVDSRPFRAATSILNERPPHHHGPAAGRHDRRLRLTPPGSRSRGAIAEVEASQTSVPSPRLRSPNRPDSRASQSPATGEVAPSMPGLRNSKRLQSSPIWFSIGVPLSAIRRPARHLEERVHAAVRVLAAVVARGRPHARVEDPEVDVGIADADPREGVELEVAAPDVRVGRRSPTHR